VSEHPTDRMIRTIDGAAADLRERLEALLQSEPTRSWMHAALLNCELLGLKNRDYGSSFRAGTRAETVYGLLVRIGDKVARARKLAKAAMLAEMTGSEAPAPAVADEPLQATLQDLACYALILQVEAGAE